MSNYRSSPSYIGSAMAILGAQDSSGDRNWFTPVRPVMPAAAAKKRTRSEDTRSETVASSAFNGDD